MKTWKDKKEWYQNPSFRNGVGHFVVVDADGGFKSLCGQLHGEHFPIYVFCEFSFVKMRFIEKNLPLKACSDNQRHCKLCERMHRGR